MRRPLVAAWRVYLVAGVLAALAYLLLPDGGRSEAALFTIMQVTVPVAIVVGVRMHRPAHPRLWYLLAAGQVLYGLGSAGWYLYPVLADVTVPYPSPVDGFYLAGYLTFLLGLLLLINRRAGRDRAGMLDTAIVTIGLGVFFWVFLMAPYAYDASLPVAERLVTLSYPALDILLVALTVRLLLAPGGREPAYLLLVAALGLQLVSDTTWALSSLAGTFDWGDPVFAGWITFFTLLGASALHPSMRTIGQPAVPSTTALPRWRLAFLAVAALFPPVVDMILIIRGGSRQTMLLDVVSAAMFLIVIGRLYDLMRDVSEQRRVSRLQSEFTSVVSHELRTPLTSIRGALGLLTSGVLGPMPAKAQRMLDIAMTNADRLVRLVNDILDIERIDSGEAPMQQEVCTVGDLVERAAAEMEALASGAGVELSVTAGSDRLHADPDRVVQTLTNLLSNAVKFSATGTTVRVTTERHDGEVWFRVADDGRGIPADKLDSIFERFAQVDASDGREKGGTGLGLAICRSIVEQHGGRIWVDSVLGAGSTFTFSLPAIDEPVGDGRRGGMILLCDDDPSVREVVAAILESRGYVVVTAPSGAEALRLAAERRPDVILLDLVMEGMDGWQTAAALGQHHDTCDIPIVILTALERGEAPDPRGAVDWVDKGADPSRLVTAVERAVGSRGATPTILLVEDDDDLAHVLIEMLARHDVRSVHARTGTEALELCDELTPDLMVLDLMLPGIDGFEVVERLRSHDRLRRMPLLVYTAKDLTAADRERLRLGETAYFTKSRVPPEAVETRVAALLERLTKEAAGVG